MMKTNFKTTSARENSPELQRYLKIWIMRALKSGPKTWQQIISSEGLVNQPVIYTGEALRSLIANCSIVTITNGYRLPSDSDVSQ